MISRLSHTLQFRQRVLIRAQRLHQWDSIVVIRVKNQAVAFSSSDINDQTTSSPTNTGHISGSSSLGSCHESKIYLHVGPSGDCWTGDSIFAAKHLQPDYVRSIPLPTTTTMEDDDDDDALEILLSLLEENNEWARELYDTEKFPSDLVKCLKVELGSTSFASKLVPQDHDHDDVDKKVT